MEIPGMGLMKDPEKFQREANGKGMGRGKGERKEWEQKEREKEEESAGDQRDFTFHFQSTSQIFQG